MRTNNSVVSYVMMRIVVFILLYNILQDVFSSPKQAISVLAFQITKRKKLYNEMKRVKNEK